MFRVPGFTCPDIRESLTVQMLIGMNFLHLGKECNRENVIIFMCESKLSHSYLDIEVYDPKNNKWIDCIEFIRLKFFLYKEKFWIPLWFRLQS